MKFFLSFLSTLALFAAVSAVAENKIVAVHDFTVEQSLKNENINGWDVAGRLESKLAELHVFKLITRAKIAKVLKERNIAATDTMKATDFGAMLGAAYIITGQINRADRKLIVTAKMIDSKNKLGVIVKSFDVVEFVPDGQRYSDRLDEALSKAARLLTMNGADFLREGAALLERHNYGEAAYYLRQAKFQLKNSEADKLLEQALAGAKKQQAILNNTISSAKKKYHQALKSEPISGGPSPKDLCDQAVRELQSVLHSPDCKFSSAEVMTLKILIDEISSYRKKLFAGPGKNNTFSIPDLKLPLLPVKGGVLKYKVNVNEDDSETKMRLVTISRDFWIGKYEVTIGQYLMFLNNAKGSSGSIKLDKGVNFEGSQCPFQKGYRMRFGKGMTWGDKNQPAVQISWIGAVNFCEWLTERERKAGRLPQGYAYRLPTEAEWQYACQAGKSQLFPPPATANDIADFAWFAENSERRTHTGGGKKPNSLGICDLSGNVWEWCYDWYREARLSADATDPVGPASSPNDAKVLRGGSFVSHIEDLQCNARYRLDYQVGKKNVGFRIVCAPAF